MTKKAESEFNIKLNSTIRKIQTAINVTDEKMSEIMDMPLRKYRSTQAGHSHYSLNNLDALCEALHITISGLMHNSLELKTVVQQFNGSLLAVPERYSGLVHSRSRCITGILNYAQIYKQDDPNYGVRTLRKLQLHPEHFKNGNSLISSNIIKDLLENLSKSGFDDESFKEMGMSTLTTYLNSELGKTCKTQNSPRQLYEELLVMQSKYFDTGFNYRILKVTPESITFESTLSDEGDEMGGDEKIGSKNVCLYRQGVFASFLATIRNGFAKVHESECLYDGISSRCVYEISWETAAPKLIKQQA